MERYLACGQCLVSWALSYLAESLLGGGEKTRKDGEGHASFRLLTIGLYHLIFAILFGSRRVS